MKEPFNLLRQGNEPTDFDAIRVGLPNPDAVHSWSHGEVKKPETINYRTYKPERDGLCCARIFGPIKDYECLCGKYKRLKHRGVVCEKCGVEVTRSRERRIRMGHIDLANPVVHVWYLKSLPSRIGLMLEMTLPDLEKVLTYERYMVTRSGEALSIAANEAFQTLASKAAAGEMLTAGDLVALLGQKRYQLPMTGQLLTRQEFAAYAENRARFGGDGDEFEAMMGAEAIQEALKNLDLRKELEKIFEELYPGFRVYMWIYKRIRDEQDMRTLERQNLGLQDGSEADEQKRKLDQECLAYERQLQKLPAEFRAHMNICEDLKLKLRVPKERGEYQALLAGLGMHMPKPKECGPLFKELDMVLQALHACLPEDEKQREQFLRICREEYEISYEARESLTKKERDEYAKFRTACEEVVAALNAQARAHRKDYEPAEKAFRKVAVKCDEFDRYDELLAQLNAEPPKTLEAYDEVLAQLKKVPSEATKKRLLKRADLCCAYLHTRQKPEWMVLTVLPVLPPDLRPLVPLEGGRFATSDLNDLYRRVINRNNRLRRLLDLGAPDIIICNEKRMLQEAVDALLDNGRRGRAVTGSNKRKLKSLAEVIKGKQGRFRQNLLGKRVDYSGRSVIVVGPTLKLHQCGLPKKMALELYKPLIIGKLQVRGIATTIKAARKQVEREGPEVWDILSEVIREHPVLLNRAPTLHRLGIQAFEPILIEGKAIQLHPLVCTAFNADFDGDQMAVHVPLSMEAQLEARALMMSSNNVLSPANGAPIIVPSQDIVLGLYYMTRKRINVKGEGMVMADIDEVQRAYDLGHAELHAQIQVRLPQPDGSMRRVETTVGRALLARSLPEGLPFDLINRDMNKRAISNVIDACYRQLGLKDTVIFCDRLMYTGFRYSTVASISFGVNDMAVPDEKEAILETAKQAVDEIEKQYERGLLTNDERRNKVVDCWSQANDDVATRMMERLEHEEVVDRGGNRVTQPSFNSIYMMSDSGARGSKAQIRQLAGMRGLMTKPDSTIIETPITANFREGLNILQYFISTHGARKGLTDTALKTANSGYLTRRLVDVAQDFVVVEDDCGTTDGLTIRAIIEGADVVETLEERVLGRVTAAETLDAKGEVLIPDGTLLDEEWVAKIDDWGLTEIKVRSSVTCKTLRGVCAKCYGRDLAHGALVTRGEAVGVVAAQSIGEPGTQLTMRTFHIGGAFSGAVTAVSNVTVRKGGQIRTRLLETLPRKDKTWLVVSRSSELIVTDDHGREQEVYHVPYGATLKVQDGDMVAGGQEIANWDPHIRPLLADRDGYVQLHEFVDGETVSDTRDELTGVSSIRVLDVKDRPPSGRMLTPAINLVNASGKAIKFEGTEKDVRYTLPANTIVNLKDGAQVQRGDVLARIPLPTQTQSGDITGGLPRVVDLFEARTKEKVNAVLAEIDGVVSYGGEVRNKQRWYITSDDGEQEKCDIPRTSHINVSEGTRVTRGEVLVDGEFNSHDVLRLRGVEALAEHIVQKIQDVYRLQGVKINDKHIEVIIRQMLRKVRVVDPGGSPYRPGELVEYARVMEKNRELLDRHRRPYLRDLQGIEGTLSKEDRARFGWMLPTAKSGEAELEAESEVEPEVGADAGKLTLEDLEAIEQILRSSQVDFEPALQGIAKSSLSRESFISAASFQETTKILVEASLHKEYDEMRGLKENVIVGRLIPAGTGLAYHVERRKQPESDAELTLEDLQAAAAATPSMPEELPPMDLPPAPDAENLVPFA